MFQLQNSNTIILRMRSRKIHGKKLIWKILEAVKPIKKIGYEKELIDSKILFFNSEQKWEKLLMKENRKGNSFFRDKISFCWLDFFKNCRFSNLLTMVTNRKKIVLKRNLLGNCQNEKNPCFSDDKGNGRRRNITSVIPSRRKIIKRASFRPKYNAVTLLPLCIKTQMLSNGSPLQKYMSHTPVSLP